MEEKSKQAAKKFIRIIKDGIVLKDNLPNSFENYSESYEDADLVSYRKYIRTLTYLDYIADRKVLYNGE